MKSTDTLQENTNLVVPIDTIVSKTIVCVNWG